jgi:hypothetical protein
VARNGWSKLWHPKDQSPLAPLLLKMAIGIVDLPMNSMGGFSHSFFGTVFQRVAKKMFKDFRPIPQCVGCHWAVKGNGYVMIAAEADYSTLTVANIKARHA